MAKAKRCGRFSRVWAALYGCEGSTGTIVRSYWEPVSVTTSRRVHVCSVCDAVDRRTREIGRVAAQEEMLRIQQEAGVADYRRARAQWVSGRPTLVSR